MLTFSRDKRLLSSNDFQRVFDKNSCRVANPSLLLLAVPNDRDHPRLGMVVAKKNIRLAVDRNRVKRAARETFRQFQHQLDAVDIIFLARKGLAELTPKQQALLLEKSWRKLQSRLSQGKP